MNTRLKLYFPMIAVMLLAACSSDDDATTDTEKPVITIEEPHDEEEVAPGGEIHFDALFTDNQELASYKIEIHNAFDGHTHSVLKQESPEDNPWSFSQSYTIPPGEKSFEGHHHIEVPAEINGAPVSEGHYHFGVYVIDAAGNEAQAFLEIHIETGAEDHDDHDHDH